MLILLIFFDLLVNLYFTSARLIVRIVTLTGVIRAIFNPNKCYWSQIQVLIFIEARFCFWFCQSQIQILVFIKALIIGWPLLENLVSSSLIARSTFVYRKFRHCPFFYQMVWVPLGFMTCFHGIWSKVEFVEICPKFFCLLSK